MCDDQPEDHEDGPGKARREPRSIPELEDFTSTELLDELMSRFDASVFIGSSSRTDTIDLYHRRWWGPHMECHGLCGYMQDTILTQFKMESEDAEE